MIHHFRIHFKNRSLKMEELPSQIGGGEIFIKKRFGGEGGGVDIPKKVGAGG